MAHGEPLLTTILNVVVDAVFHHWESLVSERAGRDISNNYAAQPAGRTIRSSDDGKRWIEEGYT